jgi:glycosyltransferase involved in cell wall biosynthesis
MKVLISIPVFNEEKNIGYVLDDIRANCPNYDILIIDDCSTDNSSFVCQSKENVNIIKLSNNLGIGGARQTAFKYAFYNNYDILVQLDGDGQHDSRYINDMILSLEKGNNICIGSRFIKFEGFQSSLMRRTGITFLYTLIKLISSLSITDPTSGFRVCDRKAIKLFANEYPVDYPEPESIVMAAKNKLKICEIPVQMKERQSGKSSIGKTDSIYFLFKVTLAILIDSISN